MDEKYLAARQIRQAVESKGTLFLLRYFCLGRIHEYPRSLEAWKEKTEWFTKCNEYRQVDSIDGEPVEFEWTIAPKLTTLQLLREIQKTMAETTIQT